MPRTPPRPTLFPYTTLFRSDPVASRILRACGARMAELRRELEEHLERILVSLPPGVDPVPGPGRRRGSARSEEHTSELQSHVNLVCRLLLEKKKRTADEVVS